MRTVVALFLLTAVVSCVDLENYSFTQFMNEYQRFYHGEELFLRKMIFERNIKKIIEHNSNPKNNYQMGINEFTDMTEEEFQTRLGYSKDLGKKHRTVSEFSKEYKLKGVKVPVSFDWRNHEFPVVSPVKDQGRCGSCWSFGAAEAVESHYAIKSGKLVELSEQQILDCTLNPLNCGGQGGCQGGIEPLAFESIIAQGGLATEWTYPYESYQGVDHTCRVDATRPPAVQLSSYQLIPENSYTHLVEALVTEGPISVSVDASTFKYYKSGVFDGCDTQNPANNHAVVLVGYGVDASFGPFWTIRNSWGPNWGENGYMRLRRSGDGFYCGMDTVPEDGSGCDDGPTEVWVCGMCGILYDNSFPDVVA